MKFKGQILKIGTVALLILGLIIGVYLVQTKKIFKSRAMDDIQRIPGEVKLHNAFDLTDEDGNPLRCVEDNGQYKCYTKTRNVKMNLNTEKLGKVLQ